MKVLQFGKFFPPDLGGIETVIGTLTNGLNQRGVRSDVLCANSKNATEVSSANGYRVIRAASYGKVFSTAISPALVFWLHKVKDEYDLIHVHMPDPMAIVALLLCRPKARIVLHWHGDVDFSKFRWLGKLYKPLDRLLVRRADRVIGATRAHIAHSSNRDLFEGKSVIVPFPLDPSFDGRLRPLQAPSLAAEVSGRFVVFSVGRLIYYKGFEFLIKAAQHLPDDCLVIIGGSGPLDGKLRALVAELGVGHKVKLAGRIPQEQLLEYYSACSVYCFPSVYRGEMFGMVQLEAMSFGKPVVSTDIPCSGVSEVNLDGVTGRVVPICDDRALADAILALKNDPQEYARLSQAARERGLGFYGCDAIIPRYIDVYAGLLGTGSLQGPSHAPGQHL